MTTKAIIEEVVVEGVMIEGMGEDVPTAITENGGKQSSIPYRFDLLDPQSMFDIARVLARGAEKYGEWNWLRIPLDDHINHAIAHLFAYLAGDVQDEHLAHAACRVMFAMRVARDSGGEV